MGTIVKLFIGVLISLAETLNEVNKRVVKCFSITITQSRMQTRGVCPGPGSAPLQAACLGLQGLGGEQGCRQRCHPSVTVPDPAGPQTGQGVFLFKQEKKCKSPQSKDCQTKMKQCQSKITAASGAPLMGSLLPWPEPQACLNVSSQWSYA